MVRILKRVGIALVILALPLIWLWTTIEKPDFPTPPPPRPAPPAPNHANRVAIPGRQVVIETNRGRFVAVLYEEDAEITCKNFVSLVQRKFYDGLTFHRVEPGFVIQTGDPTATGTGGSRKTIPLEISPILRHDSPGVLGMARSEEPNSATSQFYVTLAPTYQLDDQYAVFGKVISGMHVVKSIKKGDKMTHVYLQPAGTTKPDTAK